MGRNYFQMSWSQKHFKRHAEAYSFSLFALSKNECVIAQALKDRNNNFTSPSKNLFNKILEAEAQGPTALVAELGKPHPLVEDFAICVRIGTLEEEWLKELSITASGKAEDEALRHEEDRLRLLHEESPANADKAAEDAGNLGKMTEELGEKNKDLATKLELSNATYSKAKKSAKGKALELALGIHRNALTQVRLIYPEVNISMVHPLNVVENDRLVKYIIFDSGELEAEIMWPRLG